MKLNLDKCKVMSIGRKVNEFKYGFNVQNVGFVELEHVSSMKDLGVVFDSDLSFKNHMDEKIAKAYQMLGIIHRNFNHLDKRSFVLIFKCLIRSQLEYAHTVWSPFKCVNILDVEKVQMRATKMVAGCKSLSYVERLKLLQLPTLRFRRLRGDMIETYKILNGYYDSELVPNLNLNVCHRTRGHSFKLDVLRTKYDLRKYAFPSRIISSWNSLTEDVVQASSVNVFKNKLDKLWKMEEIYFDYEAKLPGNMFR
jgi:hypothetical protein